METNENFLSLTSTDIESKLIPPAPFYFNPSRVKAIVLGADPSNFSDNTKTKQLSKVFGIGDGDPRYFMGILNNLREVGLHLEDIYADNLIDDYMSSDTTTNKTWEKTAEQYLQSCMARLDKIDRHKKLPVLVTAERIYRFLITSRPLKPCDIYSTPENIPILPGDNKLLRPLIPFFRNRDYSLTSPNWASYRARISSFFIG